MRKIEQTLHTHFANDGAARAVSRAPDVETDLRSVAQQHLNTATLADTNTPFAIVNTVLPNSPADSAGLKPGDKIIRFGTVNWLTQRRQATISELVAQSIGVSFMPYICVVVVFSHAE
jgi:26S proteasome regulatory subunit N4